MKYLKGNKRNYLKSGGGFDILSKLGGLTGSGGGFNLDPNLLAGAASAGMQLIPEGKNEAALQSSKSNMRNTYEQVGDKAFQTVASKAFGPLGGAIAQGITTTSDKLDASSKDCITDPVTGETICKDDANTGSKLKGAAGELLDPSSIVRRPVEGISRLAQGDVSGALNTFSLGLLGKDPNADKYAEMEAQIDQRALNKSFAVNPQELIRKQQQLQYDAQQGFGTDYMYAKSGGSFEPKQTIFSNFKKGGKICAKGIAWAKRTFDKYPSAYANMAASKYCKDPDYGKNRGKDSKKEGGQLKKWREENWVKSDGTPCGNSKAQKNPARCKPSAKWKTMSDSEKAADNRKKKEGGKKGKQFVSATKKGKVTTKYTKRYLGGKL